MSNPSKCYVLIHLSPTLNVWTTDKSLKACPRDGLCDHRSSGICEILRLGGEIREGNHTAWLKAMKMENAWI